MSADLARYFIKITGRVQGVGFRPFVHHLASSERFKGWVRNCGDGVEIEIEGARSALSEFLNKIRFNKPSSSLIEELKVQELSPIGLSDFVVQESRDQKVNGIAVVPDRAVCSECLAEVKDSDNRRFRYPFTTCTSCGPRYTLVNGLPFDRANTTMNAFGMCELCQAEYDSPSSRRFHSQTNACAQCGPRVDLLDANKNTLASADEALKRAAQALCEGHIVAVKGVGGFHLMADASNEMTVRALRLRKQRESKPFAVMVRDVEEAELYCVVSEREREALQGAEAPIVLLNRSSEKRSLARSLAPGLEVYGVMLPYTPLHHVLLADCQRPLLATSANLSDEPICYRNDDAFNRLRGVADFFLLHDRDISHGLDDSIVREMAGEIVVFRRARGFYPFALHRRLGDARALAFGAQSKSTVALRDNGTLYLGPHLGSLDTRLGEQAFEAEVERLPRFHGLQPELVVCDMHSDYVSTQLALEAEKPIQKVQHHAAHVFSCVADSQARLPVLGVAWDGSGDGGDGTIWGGEFLRVNESYEVQRFASLYPFRLPGGEICAREPRRSALGFLHAICGEDPRGRFGDVLKNFFSECELEALVRILWGQTSRYAPICTSAGRLFDAAAALSGVRLFSQYEGQAAMELESLAQSHPFEEEPYPHAIAKGDGHYLLDCRPTLLALLEDRANGVENTRMAARFHLGLATGIVGIAELANENRVALTGGVFQNRFLTEAVVRLLRNQGLTPILHRSVPPNDGGIALGQLLAARGEADSCV